MSNDLQHIEHTVRTRLRSLRTTMGLSLDDLAERTNIGASTISRIETGKRAISLDVLLPLASALQIDLDSLLDVSNDDDVARPPSRMPSLAPTERKQETVDRHREVLAKALELMAEVGYHGASLRELAKRLGISQPSLYHYFASKEELVEQIIEAYAGDMIVGGGDILAKVTDREGLLALPKQIRAYVFMLWGPDSDHPKFTRFVFSIAQLDARFGRRNRELFVDQVRAVAEPALAPLVEATGIEMERLVFPLVALVNTLGFALMEEKVLFDDQPIRPEVYRLADEVVAMTEFWLAHLLERA